MGRALSAAFVYRSGRILKLWFWVQHGLTGPWSHLRATTVYSLRHLFKPVPFFFRSYGSWVPRCAHYPHVHSQAVDILSGKTLEMPETLCGCRPTPAAELRKIQFFRFDCRGQMCAIDMPNMQHCFAGTSLSTTVRDLGVTLDQELTFTEHVGKVCRTWFCHLRQIRAIRRSLTRQSVTTLGHTFVCSRVEYGNAMYAGLPVSRINHLQSILDASGRLIGRINLSLGHMSSLRQTVHHPFVGRIDWHICKRRLVSVVSA